MTNDLFYKTRDWYKARQRALLRDKYKCVFCGANVKGRGLANVDHKIKRKLRPDLALHLPNLQTLCNKCHNSTKQRDELDPNRGAGADGFPLDGSWQ